MEGGGGRVEGGGGRVQKWRRIQGSVSLEDLGPGVTIGHDVPWSNSCPTGCIIVYGRCALYTV